MDRSAPKTVAETDTTEPPGEASLSPRSAQPEVGRGWRFTLSLWLTAFGFLFCYELLTTIFQLLKHR